MRGMTQYWFNELELPNGGCLGLGCCPGYRLTPLAVIRQPGSLSEDLALIAAWKPCFVLFTDGRGRPCLCRRAGQGAGR